MILYVTFDPPLRFQEADLRMRVWFVPLYSFFFRRKNGFRSRLNLPAGLTEAETSSRNSQCFQRENRGTPGPLFVRLLYEDVANRDGKRVQTDPSQSATLSRK